MCLCFTCSKLGEEVYIADIDLYYIKLKFDFSPSCPQLWEWFVVLPVPNPNYMNGLLYFRFLSQTPGQFFWFSHSRPEIQKK